MTAMHLGKSRSNRSKVHVHIDYIPLVLYKNEIIEVFLVTVAVFDFMTNSHPLTVTTVMVRRHPRSYLAKTSVPSAFSFAVHCSFMTLNTNWCGCIKNVCPSSLAVRMFGF